MSTGIIYLIQPTELIGTSRQRCFYLERSEINVSISVVSI